MIYVDSLAKKNLKTNQHAYQQARAEVKHQRPKLNANMKPQTAQTKAGVLCHPPGEWLLQLLKFNSCYLLSQNLYLPKA
jgi:hypothetical protein